MAHHQRPHRPPPRSLSRQGEPRHDLRSRALPRTAPTVCRGHRRRARHHPRRPGRSARNADTSYEFRQSSDFHFLTGFDEPDAVAVINPGHAKERFVLFVRPRDREMEIWNGRRAGVEGAIATYGADAAYTIDELDDKAPRVCARAARPRLSARQPPRTTAESRACSATAQRPRARRLRARRRASRTRRRPRRAAAPPSARGAGAPAQRVRDHPRRPHRGDALRAARHARVPGAGRDRVRVPQGGSPRNGYPSIVASGPNATILHYSENTRRMEDGDLLLIDAGASTATTPPTSRARSR